jgi:hypothetical protein
MLSKPQVMAAISRANSLIDKVSRTNSGQHSSALRLRIPATGGGSSHARRHRVSQLNYRAIW